MSVIERIRSQAVRLSSSEIDRLREKRGVKLAELKKSGGLDKVAQSSILRELPADEIKAAIKAD